MKDLRRLLSPPSCIAGQGRGKGAAAEVGETIGRQTVLQQVT